MYDADWLPRLRQWRLASSRATAATMPANVWGLGVTSLLTDISSEMILSILPAYLVISGGMAPLAFGIVAGFHEGGPMLAAWAGGFIADRTRRRKGTAACGYVLSALCRVGWLTVSAGRGVGTITALIATDRIGKAIRTAPRDALISLSVRSEQVALAFGLHRALDAAGAAGSTRSEHIVQRALAPLLYQRTSLIIAHRLSTIRDADLIVMLDRGRIVDAGTHDQLLSRCRLYSWLWHAQVHSRSAPNRPAEPAEPAVPWRYVERHNGYAR